jgi:hypothetical protein
MMRQNKAISLRINFQISYFIYLRAYPTAQRSILKYARANEKQNKHIHTDKTKQRVSFRQ